MLDKITQMVLDLYQPGFRFIESIHPGYPQITGKFVIPKRQYTAHDSKMLSGASSIILITQGLLIGLVDNLYQTKNVGQHAIVVLEGILLFVDQALRELMDIRIFMDTPSDICLIRRVKRDMRERNRSLDSILKQYEDTVRPMYLQFIEPSKRYADVIVPRGGENRIAIDMIKAKMRELLA